MGISQQRVSQVVKNLLGASIFLKDKTRVREAIRLYLSDEEIAQTMGISQQRVSKILVNLEGASNFTSDKNRVKGGENVNIR